ncbi:hypothetical protein MBLNU459_g3843t1 [Dothideomycetes sp. NU459]
MALANNIHKVAIVGASGRIGKHFTEALLETGKHTVTALVRPDSKGTLPTGVKIARISYDDDDRKSLVAALRGQQMLVITLGVRAPQDLHSKITSAAAEAGVPYIMPNAYGHDLHNKSLQMEYLAGERSMKNCTEIEAAGASYIALTCGFWYEWSLALGEQWYGIDIKNRKVTFFDDGNTRVNTSTWAQCGRALAALASLPESGASPALSDWKNESVYISSFRVSQRDMLDSLNRVLGTTDKEWEISHQPTDQRYKKGLAEMKEGIFTGFPKAMYTRVFYPNGDGDYESSRGLANNKLGLPKENLDEATKRAVEMVESGWNPFAE